MRQAIWSFSSPTAALNHWPPASHKPRQLTGEY
jgi:hypothetical protein